MKRSQIVFVTVVFTALLTAYLAEHAEREDPFGVRFAAPRDVLLDPVDVPRGTYSLKGSVRTEDGRPAADVTVFLYRGEPLPGRAEAIQWTTTGANGRFELAELFQADYVAMLILPGHPHATHPVRVPDEDEVAWSIEPELPPVPTLPEIHRADLVGDVLPPVGLSEEDSPVADYEVVAIPAPSAHPLGGALVRRARADAQGHFRIELLVAEDYLVYVLPSWAQGGSWPILAEVYHRHEPEPPLDSPLRLRLRGGELVGRVLDPDGEPIEGALIKTWLASDPARIWPPTMTDADGAFLVRDLPEARYRIRIRTGSDAQEVEAAVLVGQRIPVSTEPMDPGGTVGG